MIVYNWWESRVSRMTVLKPLSVNSNRILIVYEYDLYKTTCAKST